MDFMDGSKVQVFSVRDEQPHMAGPEQTWQESFVVYWYDEAQEVGGGFRLGTEPNDQGGQSQFHVMLLSPDGAYRRDGRLLQRAGDVTENGLISGDDTLRYWFDGEQIRWSLNEDGYQVDLAVELTVPPINAHRRAGLESAESVLSAHVDAACHITGKMTVKGKTYQLDAKGIRDHAWGTRDLKSLHSHRWLIANIDANMSFVAMTFLSADESLAKFGWVIRGNTVNLAEQVATRAYTGDDGATTFGGSLTMTLDSGEEFQAEFAPVSPPFALAFTFITPTYYNDNFCRVTVGDKVGFGIFESSANVRGGALIPTTTDGAIRVIGWHPKILPAITGNGSVQH